MKKRAFAAIAALALCLACACARGEILPPEGPGMLGTPAVVLCRELAVRQDMVDSAPEVKILNGGDVFYYQYAAEGWYDCWLSASEGRCGYVRGDCVLSDPAWYVAEKDVLVYAWNDAAANRLAQMKKGEKLPIIRQEGAWLLLSLGGGAGWVNKSARDHVPFSALRDIARMQPLVRAYILTPRGNFTLTDPEGLEWIRANFSAGQPIMNASCPFDALLTLTGEDGKTIKLYVATDSCHIFKTEDGSFFTYGDAEDLIVRGEDTGFIGKAFWKLFGLDAETMYR